MTERLIVTFANCVENLCDTVGISKQLAAMGINGRLKNGAYTCYLKLFIIISVFLTLFIGLNLLILTRYFGTYYASTKENEFNNTVNETKATLDNTNDSDDDLYVKLKILYAEHECFAALYPTGNGNIAENNIKDIFSEGIFVEELSNILNIPYGEFMVEKSIPGFIANGLDKAIAICYSMNEK